MAGEKSLDVLLDEMKWMATDFFEERKFKRALAKRQATECTRAARPLREGKDELNTRLRTVRRMINTEVSKFWSSFDKGGPIVQSISHRSKRSRAKNMLTFIKADAVKPLEALVSSACLVKVNGAIDAEVGERKAGASLQALVTLWNGDGSSGDCGEGGDCGDAAGDDVDSDWTDDSLSDDTDDESTIAEAERRAGGGVYEYRYARERR